MTRYRYFALIGLAETLDDPFAVVRVGGEFHETFTTSLTWDRTDLIHRVDSGRDSYEVVEISEKDAKRFEKTQARRVKEVRKRDGG